MGRFGPAKLNPLPEVEALEIVMVYLLELVTEMGMIRLLPTATVPKLAVDTCSTFTAAAESEIVNKERSRRLAYTSLSGDPRRLIVISLSMPRLLSTAGDCGAFRLPAR